MARSERARARLRAATPQIPDPDVGMALRTWESLMQDVAELWRRYGLTPGTPLAHTEAFFSFTRGGRRKLRMTPWTARSTLGVLRGLLSELPADGSPGVTRKPIEVEIARLQWDRADRTWHPADPAYEDAVEAVVAGLIALLDAAPEEPAE